MRLFGDGIQVGAVSLDEFDDDRFLRLEMVVEAAGQDAAGIGDLFE